MMVSEEHFKRIVNEHQDLVFNTCLGFLKNQEETEDMTQEVFIKAYQNLDFFKGKSQLTTWLYRIAMNKCLEFISIRTGKKAREFTKYRR